MKGKGPKESDKVWGRSSSEVRSEVALNAEEKGAATDRDQKSGAKESDMMVISNSMTGNGKAQAIFQRKT